MLRAIAALLLAVSAVAADVPEQPVSEPKLVAQVGSPVIAVGKTRRYAVWSDYYIYGMELTADGKPRLETRTMIVDAHYVLQFFAVDDQFYIVYTNGSYPVFLRCIDTGATRQIDYSARVYWNGSRFLATYGAFSGTYGFLLSRDLVPLSGEIVIDTPGPYWQAVSAVNGKFFILDADHDGNARGRLVDNDGHVSASIPLPGLGAVTWPRLATSGSDFLVAWQPSEFSIAAQHISAQGNLTGELTLIQRTDSTKLTPPSVAWSGSEYIVTWLDPTAPGGPSANIRRISASSASAPQQLAAPAVSSDVSGGPAGTFVTWKLSNPPGRGFANSPQWAQRLDVADAPDVISYGVPWQEESAVAADAGQIAVVWSDRESVRLGRFDAHRTPLDGDGLEVATVPAGGLLTTARVAGNGVDYLVTWMSSNLQLFGRLVGRDGRLEGEPFQISPRLPYGTDSDVVWNGTQFLVSWDGPSFGFASVGPRGVVAPQFFNTGAGTPGIARFSGGPRPLMVYSRLVQSVATAVSGTFLDDGTPFDVMREPLFSEPNRVLLSNAHVASNGRDYLVTWTRANEATHTSEAWLARIDTFGHLTGGPILAASSTSDKTKAQAVPLFDGADYRVVVHGDAPPLAEAVVDNAAFVCSCLDAADLPLGIGVTSMFGRLAAAAGGRGQVAISYDRIVVDPFIAYRGRAFLRLLGYPAPRRRAAGK